MDEDVTKTTKKYKHAWIVYTPEGEPHHQSFAHTKKFSIQLFEELVCGFGSSFSFNKDYVPQGYKVQKVRLVRMK